MKITVDLTRLSDGRIKAVATTSGGEDGIWSIRDSIPDAMYAVAPASLTEDAPKSEDNIGAGALSIGGERPTSVQRRIAVGSNAIVNLLEQAILDDAEVKLDYTDSIGKHTTRIVEPEEIRRVRPSGGLVPERALIANDGEASKTFYVSNGVSGAQITRAEIV